MRSKEEAHDYRYFPEPDLVPVEVDNSWTEHIKTTITELPGIKRKRFVSQYNLPEYDVELLTSERSMAEWSEQAIKLGADPKSVSNWIMGELMRYLNEDNILIDQCALTPELFVDLLHRIDKGEINRNQGKIVLKEMYNRSKGITITPPPAKIKIEALSPEVIIKEKGLVQISDETDIERAVNEVLEKNQNEVERYRAGEEKLLGFFVGQIMKLTKGRANPRILNELLKKKLRQ